MSGGVGPVGATSMTSEAASKKKLKFQEDEGATERSQPKETSQTGEKSGRKEGSAVESESADKEDDEEAEDDDKATSGLKTDSENEEK